MARTDRSERAELMTTRDAAAFVSSLCGIDVTERRMTDIARKGKATPVKIRANGRPHWMWSRLDALSAAAVIRKSPGGPSHSDDAGAYLPTQEEIYRRAAELRKQRRFKTPEDEASKASGRIFLKHPHGGFYEGR